MLDALALQPVFASSWPVWHVFTLRDDDALQSKLARMLEHCGAVLFKVLAEIGLASWREKRRQVAPASVEAIAVERTRITKAVMAAGFQVRLQNR